MAVANVSGTVDFKLGDLMSEIQSDTGNGPEEDFPDPHATEDRKAEPALTKDLWNPRVPSLRALDLLFHHRL